MTPNAAKILEEIRQLPPNERDWRLEGLLAQRNEEAFATMEAEYGKPEPGYEEWFRAGVEEALADDSLGIPHEEAMKPFHEAILRARAAARI